MTGRDMIEAALSPQGTPTIPAVICYEDIYIRDHWAQLTPCPWWYEEVADLKRQMQWRRQAIERTGQDWFYLPTCGSRQERSYLAVEARPEGVFRVDRRTGRAVRLAEPQVGGWTATGGPQSVHPGRLADTPEAIEALIPLLPNAEMEALRADGRADLAVALRAEFGGLYPIRHVSSPLWRCYDLWGFEGMMSFVATRPDLVHTACRRFLVSSLQGVRAAARLGARGMWIEECLTDMVSPQAFARFNLPYLQELVEAVRTEGMHSIYYFCGNPAGKWDLLLDAGADALSLEESKKGFAIDIEEVVERVRGRCAVLGNLDAMHLLERGTEAELRVEIARQIAAGRRNGSRFIMSLGSPVTPGTPVSRVRLYCDLAHEMGAG